MRPDNTMLSKLQQKFLHTDCWTVLICSKETTTKGKYSDLSALVLVFIENFLFWVCTKRKPNGWTALHLMMQPAV